MGKKSAATKAESGDVGRTTRRDEKLMWSSSNQVGQAQGTQGASSSRPRWRRQGRHHQGDHQRVSPRVFRVVALTAPTEREKSQMYLQRYVVLSGRRRDRDFDRSWYNRAGVERVMGFCSEEEVDGFLQVAPMFEKLMVHSGILLLKYWLEVSQRADAQTRGAHRRRAQDLEARQWTSSPTIVGTTIQGRATRVHGD